MGLFHDMVLGIQVWAVFLQSNNGLISQYGTFHLGYIITKSLTIMTTLCIQINIIEWLFFGLVMLTALQTEQVLK